jgi:predicted amino acid-binding ACT domain protein
MSSKIFYLILFHNMSKHDQDREQLREYLLQAHQLVGEKVEIKQEG